MADEIPEAPPPEAASVQNWMVKDIIDRIKRDDQEVGFHLPWCEWYAKVSPKEAANILDRFNPNTLFSVSIVAGTLFISAKK